MTRRLEAGDRGALSHLLEERPLYTSELWSVGRAHAPTAPRCHAAQTAALCAAAATAAPLPVLPAVIWRHIFGFWYRNRA